MYTIYYLLNKVESVIKCTDIDTLEKELRILLDAEQFIFPEKMSISTSRGKFTLVGDKIIWCPMWNVNAIIKMVKCHPIL